MDPATYRRIYCAFLLIGTFSRLSVGEYLPAPHIIVFMVDDLGWNDVGFHGSNQIPTPNIDALAYEGIILNRHYTLPSCTASRAAFFTGQYPVKLGLQGKDIRGGEPRSLSLGVRILPQYLADLGYSTHLLGKWHLGFQSLLHTPVHRGFHSFFGFYNNHISYFNYGHRSENMTGFDLHRGDSPAHDVHGRYATELFTDEAIKIIDRHEPIHPLYLQINHLGVSSPLEKPKTYHPEEHFKHLNNDSSRQTYAMMVSEIDESLGRIVTALGDRGMLTNSIIVFLTDNGAETMVNNRSTGSNWPLRGSKHSMYEGGVRGVAAMWSPRLRKMAEVSDNLMHMTDWLPTLYAAAGGQVYELDNRIDGINFWPHFTEAAISPRRSLLLNIDAEARIEGAILNQYKLLRGNHQDDPAYDSYSAISGREGVLTAYNYDAVHRSAVASTIGAHTRVPLTQTSVMTHIRERAKVMWTRNEQVPHPCQNEMECLFDIYRDPCETTNIAKQSPEIVKKIDKILMRYGNESWKQKSLPIDYNADPRLHNSTWVPWQNPSWEQNRYAFNAATTISTLAVCAHIGMVLLIVGLRAYI